MLTIGNLTLSVPFIQAPLSGYSDYAMRRLALDFSVPLTFSGVMLAKSAAHPERKQAQKTLLAANSQTQLLAAIEKWYGENYNGLTNQDKHLRRNT